MENLPFLTLLYGEVIGNEAMLSSNSLKAQTLECRFRKNALLASETFVFDKMGPFSAFVLERHPPLSQPYLHPCQLHSTKVVTNNDRSAPRGSAVTLCNLWKRQIIKWTVVEVSVATVAAAAAGVALDKSKEGSSFLFFFFILLTRKRFLAIAWFDGRFVFWACFCMGIFVYDGS